MKHQRHVTPCVISEAASPCIRSSLLVRRSPRGARAEPGWLRSLQKRAACGHLPGVTIAAATLQSFVLFHSSIRMRNPLQDQLLKAGLVKKSKVAQVVREQTRQRQGKAPPVPETEKVDAQQLQAERAERDRALAVERNAQARLSEKLAQVRQIVEMHRIRQEGEISYRFDDGGRIKCVRVNHALRAQLASGAVVVVRHGEGHELLPRAAAEKVRARDPAMIVLDHACDAAAGTMDDDDEFYRRFEVPDDLIW
jgi:uncharacterized protein